MPETQPDDGPLARSAAPWPVDPALAKLDHAIGNLVVNRFTYRMLRLLGRWARGVFDPAGVTVEYDQSPGPRLAIINPAQRRGDGALMLFHGGGFVIGAPEDIFPKAAAFAQALGVPVICPAYRLAPQAPFPAALNDAHGAWHRAAAAAKAMAVNPAKIVIGGFSAGAGLAACLAQRLHDEGGIQPAAQLLVYPMLDDRTAQRTAIDTPRHRVWSNRNNRFAWRAYLGRDTQLETLLYTAAARRDNLIGLPPVWLGVGDCDLFLDEVRLYRSRLLDAGVAVTYDEVAGAIHGFDMDDNQLAHAFTGKQIAFAQNYVGPAGSA